MKKSKSSISIKKILWGLIVLVLVGLSIWGISWATYARPPLPEAVEALEGDDLVTVTKEPWLTFSPAKDSPTTGLIFYPGGRVDPRAYAHLMRAIASEGYLVVIPEMPINMAVFNPNVADKIIDYYPNINHWAIAGHSVGGTMAVQYTDRHPEAIEGLAIWASYPANSSDISDLDIPVISIYGSREVTVTDTSVGERAHGSYEINPEDHLATISRESQHQQIIQATLDLLADVSNSK